jgi:predicted ATPase
MEQIRIKTFAGIDDLTIELNKVNIFIGKQASGKSITAKLIYFFKGITREFFDAAVAEKTKVQVEKKLIQKFEEYFPAESWPSKNFEIVYSVNGSSVTIKKEKSKLKIIFSESYIKLLNFSKKIIKSDRTKFNQEGQFEIYRPNYKVNERYLDLVQKELGEISSYNPLFIPAGRSFFANLQSSIFSFLSNNKAMDPFLVEFGSFYENIKPFASRMPLGREDKHLVSLADKITYDIIGSKYLREKNKDFLVHADKRKINVSFTSSGQQETLPLILILRALMTINFIGNGSALFVEEPEAHLFPAAQKKVIELMGLTFNNSKSSSQLIVTTHSPYVLTSVNNLIQASIAFNSADTINKEKVVKIIPKELMINNTYLNAYAFKNGTAESIVDKETGLIYSKYLDSVSEEISIEFDNLLNID